MQKIFKILLILGIILLLNAGYFLIMENEVVSLFLAIFGLLIFIFSIFEIIIHKKDQGWRKLKVKKKEKKRPIASRAKGKPLKEDMEWTSYDVWDEKKSEDVSSKKKDGGMKKEKKPSLFKRLFSSKKVSKKTKVNVKTVEKEVEKEVKEKVIKDDKKEKIVKDDDKTKEQQLREYISSSLENKVPKEKIIEAALSSDWPQLTVLKAFKELSKKDRKKKLAVLSVLFIAILALLGLTFFSGEFLLFYWIESMSTLSPAIYGLVILGFFIVIMVLLIVFKMNMSDKKKVYKMLKQKKVEELKGSSEESTVVSEIDASFYKTDIDKLLDMVNKKGSLSVDEVAKIFSIKKVEAEEWGKILKDEGLISLYYPTVGDAELRRKKKVKEEEE